VTLRFDEVDDLRRAARRRVPRMIADFVDGGADGEWTVGENRNGFDGVTFRPRQLVDVSERDQSVDVFGDRLALPVMLAPAGLARLVHRRGELAAARAAAGAGTLFCASIASSFTLEDIAAASPAASWFQLYLWKDRSVVSALVERAQRTGYRTLCLTVDVPIVGKRIRDLRNGLTLPPRIRLRTAFDTLRRPRWLAGLARGPKITFSNLVGLTASDAAVALATYVNTELINPAASWQDLEWLRDLWEGPIVVKGVLGAADARRAVEAGADGVVVSNHGGRQLDGAPATIRVLPDVVAAVGDSAVVFLDGGVRRGADVVKAVALGARAVLVGRPWFWGLAADGERGVSRMLELFSEEIDRTLALIGRPSLADVDSSAVAIG
jgi:isopentenyl diphosphate isomerase/L-lactate dehydrogenase-like FMN-dependent dehydrogenase